QCVAKIESKHCGCVIRRIQADDLRMAAVGLREKILIRANQVCDLHAIAISVLARAKYVAVKVNRFISEGHDRRDFYLVTVLNLGGLHSLRYGLHIRGLRHMYAELGTCDTSFL